MPGLEHMIGYVIAERMRRGAVILAFVAAWLGFVAAALAIAVLCAAVLGFRAPSIQPFVPPLVAAGIPAGIYAALRVRESLRRLLVGPGGLTRS